MKPKKLFWKLFPPYFFISLIGLVVLLVITRFAFQKFFYKVTINNLTQKANLIKVGIKKKLQYGDYEGLTKLVINLAKISENRITILLPNGVVVVDSSYDYRKMENHMNRPEIKDAISRGLGESVRFSETLQTNQLYLAISMRDNGPVLGIIRLSVSLEKLHKLLFNLTENVLFWSIILLLFLTYFIFVQAKKISYPLEKIKNQVENFEKNEFQEKIEFEDDSIEEILSLSKAFKKMSINLQKQLKKVNNQKNEQLAVFSSMLEGVITIYPDMSIYHINQAAIEMFEYDGNENTKGIPFKDIVKSDYIYNLANELLANGKRIDHEFEHRPGRILNIHGTILKSEKTGMTGAVLVFNDISKMRELENYRKEFVANVSHELKTPLTAIMGYVETIKDDSSSISKDIILKFVDVIHKHSVRLKTIVEDLLSLSSIEKDSEVGELNLESQKLKPIVENVILLCEDRATKKSIKFSLIAEEVVVKINIPLFEQALINLIDNAIKYGPTGSIIDIKMKKVKDLVQISIKDEGQGIAKKHHERLFERFYSADKARSRELGGSGLGLSIVKHIAFSHGGNIYVRSELGAGSTFTLELPLA